jgi:hypothetical protein
MRIDCSQQFLNRILETLPQKKAKVGRPKLPKGEAKGRIVPVRFTADDCPMLHFRNL